jgi:hypothetical protein
LESVLNDLSELIEQIKNLSPKNRAKLADYVAFLQWRETQHQAKAAGWSFSFIESFKEAAVYATEDAAGMDVKMAPAIVGSESRPALWAHPPLTGQAVIEYHVPVPQQITELHLHLSIGIRDGAEIDEDNLVAFGVKVNGLRVWGQQSTIQTWQDTTIPLDVSSGDMAQIAFTTEALGSHQWTWAVWGEPELKGIISS